MPSHTLTGCQAHAASWDTRRHAMAGKGPTGGYKSTYYCIVIKISTHAYSCLLGLTASSAVPQEAMRKLAEEKHKPKVEKNNFKCPKCHRVG